MFKEILGMDAAKAEAKRIGLNNMTISAPLVLEMAERIEDLERRMTTINDAIFAKGAPLGSDEYFIIRFLVTNTVLRSQENDNRKQELGE